MLEEHEVHARAEQVPTQRMRQWGAGFDTWSLSACAVHETIRVKSAAWDDSGVLVYTTLNHIKCGAHPQRV